MSRLTIGKKLGLGFGTLLPILCGIALVATIGMHRASAGLRRIEDGYVQEMTVAQSFEREILNARINFIYYVTIQRPGSLEKGWKRFVDARALVPQLEELAENSQFWMLRKPSQGLTADMDKYEGQLRELLELVARGENHDGRFTELLPQWAEQGRKLVDTAALLNRTSVELCSKEVAARAAESRAGMLIVSSGSVAACLVGLLIWWLIGRSISVTLQHAIKRLTMTANALASTSREVESASHQLAAGASRQAISVEETAASCREISVMSAKDAENAQMMERRLSEAERASDSAAKALERMVATLLDVAAAGEAVQRIAKTIDDFAFQTNMLALNAAVEAARAGEFGSGFGVVAGEVRSLAERSGEAAREASSLIERSVSTTAASRVHIENVARLVREMADSARGMREMAENVSRGTAEELLGVREISLSLGRIEAVTQSVADGAERTAESASQVFQQANAMRDVVGDLTALVGA